MKSWRSWVASLFEGREYVGIFSQDVLVLLVSEQRPSFAPELLQHREVLQISQIKCASKLCDDRLHLRVLLQSVFAQLAPDSRLLKTAERRSGIHDVVAIH